MAGLLLSLLMTLAPTTLRSTEAPHKVWRELCPAQGAIMRSTAPEAVYSGRRFGGKSNVGCAKSYTYGNVYRGARVAVSRLERKSMDATTLLTLRSEIVPADVWARYWREAKSTLALPNGSELHVFGLDDPERQMGSRWGFWFIDQAEQLNEHTFELVNSGVMQVGMPWHQTMLAFNPANPEHWAFKRYDPDAGDGPRYDANGRHFADVVHVLPDDLLEYLTPASRERLDGMSGVWRQRYRLGLWTAFEGSVYGDLWSPGQHVVDPPEAFAAWFGYPPPTWPRYRAIDFGIQNPFVCSWYAEDPDGVLWRYRELYRTGLITEDAGALMLEAEAAEMKCLNEAAVLQGSAANGLEPYLSAFYSPLSVSDPARPDLRETLARMGLPTIGGENDVHAGIDAVRSRLAVGPHGPRIRFIKGSSIGSDPTLIEKRLPRSTEEEVPGYRWQRDRATGAEVGPRDVPVKQNDHGCDPLRYLCLTMDRMPRPGVW